MSARVAAARAKLQAARDALDKAIERAWPAGTEISWSYGEDRTVFHGVVLSTGWQDSIRVRNHATGKERWITSWHVLNAMPKAARS